MMNDYINDYKIIDLIGEGAYGKVYKVEGVDHNTYALKIIPINKQIREKIREEGKLLTSLDHPNILWAREFFYFQQQKYFVIITEFCDGGGLDSHIGEIDEERKKNIMKETAQGLSYLHSKSIMHRDLKPQNILLKNWSPRIADMGVAKMIRTYQASTKIGTPVYMAPEMLQDDYGIEVDIWALGILFIELILGKRIFQLLKGQEIPAKRSTFPSNDLLQKITDQKMRAMIFGMLKKDPRERITIDDVLGFFIENKPTGDIVASNNRMSMSKNNYQQVINDCYTKTQQFWANKYPSNFIKQLYEKNMVQIVNMAEGKNKKALFLQAKMYQNGYGMIKNKQKAQQIFMECYELSEPHSCFQLYCLSTSTHQRFRYLMSGKQFEQVRCISQLTQNYLEGGDGIEVDYQEAEVLIQSLCQRNFPAGHRFKAILHSKRNTEYYNYEQSKKAFLKGSSLGDIPCKIMYANDYYKQKRYQDCLRYLEEVQKDYDLHQREKLNLFQLKAKCYSKVKQTQKLVQSYHKCIQLDHFLLQKDYIGSIASYFESIEKYDQAINYYNQAISSFISRKPRTEYVKNRLKELFDYLYTLYFDRSMYKDAFFLAGLSAQNGYGRGYADQAYMIFIGAGVNRDEAKGLSWLSKLAKQGNIDAMEYLKDIEETKK